MNPGGQRRSGSKLWENNKGGFNGRSTCAERNASRHRRHDPFREGGEADVVFLFPDLRRAADAAYQKHGPDRDSVIRPFYVGMTRARHTLYICQQESQASNYLTRPLLLLDLLDARERRRCSRQFRRGWGIISYAGGFDLTGPES